jgi:sterol desaturase/sphingolipid hydroxylase (fatty acid hydroxylase superfamily)
MQQSDRPPLDRWFDRVFNDTESAHFGTGWISGTGSVFLGGLAVLGVVVFWFPGALTTQAFRSQYPVNLLRSLLEVLIGLAFLFGAISMMLRKRKVLGLTGIALAFVALLAGGGEVPIESDFTQPYTIGLDWFLLNVLLTALVFVPVERAFPRLRDQKTFRFAWTTDGMYLLLSHLAIQALMFTTLLPATTLARFWQPEGMQSFIRDQPLWLQFLVVVLVVDFFQYWIHRAFHRVPWLWHIHAVHHSSRVMDWLAGSRLHFIDAITTRGLVMIPVFLLGFGPAALYAYIVFVSFHSVFIHANLRFRFGWLDRVIATPRGHHWHHAVAPVDVNFAVHLPFLDRVFGTQHLPGDRWPSEYGIAGHPVPEGWGVQLGYPFRRKNGLV